MTHIVIKDPPEIAATVIAEAAAAPKATPVIMSAVVFALASSELVVVFEVVLELVVFDGSTVKYILLELDCVVVLATNIKLYEVLTVTLGATISIS